VQSPWRQATFVVTGGAGFLGRHVVARLRARGVGEDRIIVPRRSTCDLRRQDAVEALLVTATERAAGQTVVVVHLAGNVGGIGYNRDRPGELFYDNVVMGAELMEAARRHGAAKFVAVATVCAYPKHAPVPFREVDLWNGYPEETNAPYGLAKKMLVVQADAYRRQYGFDAITLLPVNLYGPGDDFDPASSHVIPALVRKCIEARERRLPAVEIWGDGSPTREFLYVEDAAEAITLATERYSGAEPVNVGSGHEIGIKALAERIAALVGFEGTLIWDPSKPNGQPRRRLDVTAAERLFGFRARTALDDGLRRTIAWFEDTRGSGD
jgi:GDP-L-fucose synthase